MSSVKMTALPVLVVNGAKATATRAAMMKVKRILERRLGLQSPLLQALLYENV